jgi:hypothetical protein
MEHVMKFRLTQEDIRRRQALRENVHERWEQLQAALDAFNQAKSELRDELNEFADCIDAVKHFALHVVAEAQSQIELELCENHAFAGSDEAKQAERWKRTWNEAVATLADEEIDLPDLEDELVIYLPDLEDVLNSPESAVDDVSACQEGSERLL